ncbi:MAG TPA: PAS domain-containing protein [Anaeromyxobacteraceae bacterium]|nr:PAS domain-containing protein [Anaeromyxobacteraceae bacterium]
MPSAYTHEWMFGQYERPVSLEPFDPLRVDLAFSSLPEPVLLVGADGGLERVNRAAMDLLGEDVALAAQSRVPVAEVLPWLRSAVERVALGADAAGIEVEVETAGGPRRLAARLRRFGEHESALGVSVVLEDLTERHELELQQRSAERLSALGTLAAGLAHEVNSPLACVVAGLAFVEAEHERLSAALAPAELSEAKLALEEARNAALRVGRVVRSLQNFGQPAFSFLEEVEVHLALDKALRLAEPCLSGRARVVLEVTSRPRVRVNEPLLVELLLALVAHAALAFPGDAPASNLISITVRANRSEACVHLGERSAARKPGEEGAFDPALQSRPALKGSGLSMSRGIAVALGGSLALGSGPDGSTSALVRLPRSD